MVKSKQYELLQAPPASSFQQLTAHPSHPTPCLSLPTRCCTRRGENEGTQSLHKGNKRATHAELKRSNEGTQHALLLPSFQPLVTSLRATRLLRHDDKGGEARPCHRTRRFHHHTPQHSRISGRLEFYLSPILQKLPCGCHDHSAGPSACSWAASYGWPQAVPLQGLPALGQMDIASQQRTLQRRAYVKSTLESYISLSSYLYLDTQSPLPSSFLVLRYTIQLFHCHQTTPLTSHC